MQIAISRWKSRFQDNINDDSKLGYTWMARAREDSGVIAKSLRLRKQIDHRKIIRLFILNLLVCWFSFFFLLYMYVKSFYVTKLSSWVKNIFIKCIQFEILNDVWNWKYTYIFKNIFLQLIQVDCHGNLLAWPENTISEEVYFSYLLWSRTHWLCDIIIVFIIVYQCTTMDFHNI